MRTVESSSESETMKIAGEFAATLSAGDVVCLRGDLGAGKTHFVKGFVQAFGIKPEQVTSPTFTLINEYSGTLPVYHFDCYRLDDPLEALEFGAEEYFYGGGVCIIEWPNRIEAILPDNIITVELEITGPGTRCIVFKDPK